MNRDAAQVLHETAGHAARRLTLLRSLRAGFAGGSVVLGALAGATVATAAIPLAPVPVTSGLGAALAAAGFITVALFVLRPVDRLAAVRLLDVRAGLDERTSTALEVAASGEPTPMRRRLLDDAAAAATSADLRSAFPYRSPRTLWIMAACALLLFIWPSTLRGLAIPGTPAHRSQQVIRREGGRLEQFARMVQSRTQRTPQTRRIAPRIRDLGSRLQQERVDRADALARIADLTRQVEEARRDVDSRIASQRPPRQEDTVPQQLFRRESLQQQIRQLRELTARLQQNPQAASQDALQRLGEISRSGEGTQPARAQRRLQQAREELAQGNIGGAGESLTEALRELEGLDAMLADREGLQRAQQQLQRSQQAIAGGNAGQRDGEVTAEDTGAPPSRGAGEHAPGRELQAEAQPPQGPHEGTTPGQGRVTDKMGAPSQRLQGERRTDRLRGAQSEGPVSSADVLGAGRPGTVRSPVESASPAIVAQADRAMESSRTPARYRALVRRYFERLARLR